MERTFPIFEKIWEELPKDANIVSTCFEGANIVLYTKNTKMFLHSQDLIRRIVDKIKKRVEIRPDSSVLWGKEETEEFIRDLLPKEADIFDIWFDEKLSTVIIEAARPGIVIGRGGMIMKNVREKTYWIPKVMRAPSIKSNVIRTIRKTLYEHSDYRRIFMDKIGQKIFSKWERGSKYWVRMSCLGGFREVGRSCIFLQTPESRVLLDCGVNIAAPEEYAYPFLEAPEFDIKELDAVIISHSHLDHMGSLPILYKYGYRGPVYCTAPTLDVMTLLQLDFIDVAFREAKKCPYSSKDIKEVVKHSVTLSYGEVTDVTPDVRLTLFNAGHIIGSSLIHLNIGNGFHNILYTGDLKYARTKLLDPANSQFQRVETVVIESTYGAVGDRLPQRKECEDGFFSIVKNTIARGGKVIVPVLGVGRAQEVLLIIEEAIRFGKIPKIPIYVDGMVWDVTAIHTAYPEFLNKHVRNLIFKENFNPFLSKDFRQVGSHKERMNIIEDGGPCVIIATSGMLTGGPVISYFKELAGDKRNSMIFVCYQGEGSLGRRICKGEREIPLSNNGLRTQTIKINLEVFQIHGLTGHSDRGELMSFLRNMKPRPRRVIINHGESSKCLDLASSFHKTFRVETTAPRELDVLRIR